MEDSDNSSDGTSSPRISNSPKLSGPRSPFLSRSTLVSTEVQGAAAGAAECKMGDDEKRKEERSTATAIAEGTPAQETADNGGIDGESKATESWSDDLLPAAAAFGKRGRVVW